jgi:hypothetical protein
MTSGSITYTVSATTIRKMSQSERIAISLPSPLLDSLDQYVNTGLDYYDQTFCQCLFHVPAPPLTFD